MLSSAAVLATYIFLEYVMSQPCYWSTYVAWQVQQLSTNLVTMQGSKIKYFQNEDLISPELHSTASHNVCHCVKLKIILSSRLSGGNTIMQKTSVGERGQR